MRIKREEITKQKQEEILEITKKLLLTYGIKKLSMRSIARALHQTPGNIYHYFKNKEEILVALTRKEYIEIMKNVTHEIEGTAKQQLSYKLTKYIELMIEKYCLFHVITHIDSIAIQNQIQILTPEISKHRGGIQALCDVLEKGCKEGEFQIRNIEMRAQVIISATQGVVQRIAIEKPEHSREIIKEHIEMILQSLEGDKNEPIIGIQQ